MTDRSRPAGGTPRDSTPDWNEVGSQVTKAEAIASVPQAQTPSPDAHRALDCERSKTYAPGRINALALDIAGVVGAGSRSLVRLLIKSHGLVSLGVMQSN